jgi:hypothetical protein
MRGYKILSIETEPVGIVLETALTHEEAVKKLKEVACMK